MCTIKKFSSAASLACKVKNGALIDNLIFDSEFKISTSKKIDNTIIQALNEYNQHVQFHLRIYTIDELYNHYQRLKQARDTNTQSADTLYESYSSL